MLFLAVLPALALAQSQTGIAYTSFTTSTTTAAASLAAYTSSWTYTATTATTTFSPPHFATSSPIPSCSNTMCPGINGKSCKDSNGDVYGILCDTHFSGIVITASGKKERDASSVEDWGVAAVEERDYAGTFDNCASFCDYSNGCTGVDFNARGFCRAYSGSIDGSYASPGQIAAIRGSGQPGLMI